MADEWVTDATVRAGALARVLVSVVIDLLFLAGVVVTNWAAQEYIFEQFDLHGTARVGSVVLEWFFMVATLGTVLSYLLRDLYVAILRPWRQPNEGG